MGYLFSSRGSHRDYGIGDRLAFSGRRVVTWLWRAPPKQWRGGGLAAALPVDMAHTASFMATLDWPLLTQIGLFFAKAGAFVFGSGLAIVPFLYGGVVTEHHWLNEKQFVDAVAVAMITPGPVVITVGFIGYLVAGLSWRVCCGSWDIPAVLPVHHHPRTVFQEIRQAARHRGLCGRSDSRSCWRDHRFRHCHRQAQHRGCAHCCDGTAHGCHSLEVQEAAGACGCGDCCAYRACAVSLNALSKGAFHAIHFCL